MHSKVLKVFLTVLVAGAIAGCQTIEQKRRIDYRNTRTLPPLEIPPDLSTLPDREHPAQNSGTASATYSDLTKDQKSAPAPGAGQAVLPQYDGIRIARDGQTRWLVVKAEPQALWDPVREFVMSNGLLIAEENPTTGVIETDWAENRANVGNTGQKLLTKWLGSLYSTGMRDKYRLRLERGAEPGTTEIYLSHQGMEEEALNSDGSTVPTGSYWKPRPSDPELETEMLQRLVAHLGGQQAVAKAAADVAPAPAPADPAPANAQLKRSDDGVSLALQDSLDRAWRRVGLSLDRIGFTVEDRDRSKGIYFVRYIDPEKQGKTKGVFSRWFGGDEKLPPDQYQVHLKPAASGTEVEVLNKNGGPESSKTGERILSLLYEQLK
ncbi:MAG: outer membrane protein assembly factor BamC [Gammaproteobacteria bacterium]